MRYSCANSLGHSRLPGSFAAMRWMRRSASAGSFPKKYFSAFQNDNLVTAQFEILPPQRKDLGGAVRIVRKIAKVFTHAVDACSG